MTVRSVSASSLGLDGRTRSIVEAFRILTPLSVEYLVVGGGASGAHGLSGVAAGGGGAGGYRCNVSGENSGGGASAEPSFEAIENFSYSLIVGAGGAGVISATSVDSNNGSDSVFGLVRSFGGGLATIGQVSQSFGGSGGGAGATNNQLREGGLSATNQGFDGGDNFGTATVADRGAGGGGGAGAVGANAALDVGGNGGNGVASSITGSSVTRGGGGGGCTSQQSGGTQGTGGTGGGGAGRIGNNNGFSGDTNTGSGGGGISVISSSSYTSGSGGSGVVILKYPDIYTATFSAGVTQSTSTSGGFKVSTITATSTTSETVTFA